MKRVISLLIVFLLFCGCTHQKSESENKKISVVTTIFPLYDFARAVGGESIELKMLIKPGNEVHTYDPLPSDMVSIVQSDLFLYIGGESDEWVNTLLADYDVNARAFLDEEHNHSKNGHKHMDEHIWTSPSNAVKMVEQISEYLSEIDAQNSQFYNKNAKEYIKEIQAASNKIANLTDEYESPFMLVADRFPFSYFAEEYGIEYAAAFDACAVSTDISITTMSRLVNVIKKNDIKAVFCTELSTKNIANAISELCDVSVIELHSAHNVTLDEFSENITYVDILNKNIESLREGLCECP